MVGWALFTVSAIFFTIGALRSGGIIELIASGTFLLACLVFIVPAFGQRPGQT
jgi:hypothetical protein